MNAQPLLENIDFLSPDYVNNLDKYVPQVLEHSPVFFYPPLNIWVISKYDDVRKAFSDYDTFSANAWGVIPPPPDLESRVQDMNTDVRINSMDPPEHAKLRAPVQEAFMPAGLTSVDTNARRIANNLIDGFIDRGSCDLLEDFCNWLPLNVVMDFLGLPKEHAGDYHRWGTSLFALFTPKQPDGTQAEHLLPMPEEVLRGAWMNLAEANEFLRPVVENLDAHPGNNLLSRLLQLREPDGSRTLSLSDNVRNALDFVTAGHETTATLIAHMVYYACTVPGLRQRLEGDEAVVSGLLDETLRIRGSADGFFRLTKREVNIRGVDIPKGSIVYLYLTAANMDPAVFADPWNFDTTRPNLRNALSFGYGKHTCVGRFLAKIEAKAAFEELFRRIPTIRLPQGFKIRYSPSVINVLIESLPVEWDVA